VLDRLLDLAEAFACALEALFLLLVAISGGIKLTLSIALIKPYWRLYEKCSFKSSFHLKFSGIFSTKPLLSLTL
jgi:hypothetical protein